jgi:2-dehydro-3-deoxyphosphogluconate aldolase / (4S)-4-hydroxy-2-oxoglutarate aldolase
VILRQRRKAWDGRRSGVAPRLVASIEPRTRDAQPEELVSRLAEIRFIPIASIDPELAEPLGRTLIGEGIACLEVALRQPGAIEALERACAVEGLLVGAGTVLTPAQATAAAEAGAAFAVAPGLNTDVVDRCCELGLPFFPGVATPSEIDAARRLGLATVKLFPLGPLGGLSFLRAISAVFPDMRFIPTGGIDQSNVGPLLEFPSVVACGGSWLFTEQLLRAGSFDELARRARELVAIRRACAS